MPGRTLDQDILNHAFVAYINFQQGCALNALPSGGLRIAWFALIPAQRPGQTTPATWPGTACARRQPGYPCAATGSSTAGAQAGTARATTPTSGASARHHSGIAPLKELPG